MKHLKRSYGFTLIEILVVIAIIGILFFVFVPQVESAFLKSKESGIYTDFRSFQQSSESYFRETLGRNLQTSALNKYLSAEHKVSDNGILKQTISKDPWKNPYEVTLGTNKITFSSYGKDENPASKPYNMVTYLHNGEISSCTTGLGSRNIQITFRNLDPGFQCGDDLSTVTPPPSTALNAPTVFVATNVTQTKAELSWNVVSGAVSYVLKKDGATIYTGSNTSFSDITLTADTTYNYSVAAKNGSDVSPYASLTVKTNSAAPAPAPLPAPTNFVANSIADTSIDLSWDSVAGATSYMLMRNGVVAYTGNSTFYSDATLSPNTTYTYVLIARNSTANSSFSVLEITTRGGNPLLVKDLVFDFNGVSIISLATDDALISWGNNNIGQLGTGTVSPTSLPTKIGNDTNWLRIVSGDGSYFGIKKNGTLWSWGVNTNGQLGHGDKVNQLTPKQVGTDTKWKEVVAGDNHVIALKTDGTIWSWGVNNVGQLGTNASTTTPQLSPNQIGTDTNWEKIYASVGSVFAIKTNGTLWSWGLNHQGELGLGDTNIRKVPNQIGTDTNWKDVSYTDRMVAAIKTDGTLWTWGQGSYGKLGHGDSIDKHIPTKVGTDSNWKSAFTRGHVTGAIKTDGTLWMWGFGAVYQLAHQNNYNLYVPTKIGTDSNWKDIVIGYDFVIGSKTDGTLWSWGQGRYGGTGHGSTNIQRTPKQIGKSSDWKSIKIAYDSVFAVKNNDTVWGWGRNLYGQLGYKAENDEPVPTPTQIFMK